jgi:hypothetical protein
MLVDTLQELSRPEFRAAYSDSAVLAEVRAQLARPASPYPCGASNFSWRKLDPSKLDPFRF